MKKNRKISKIILKKDIVDENKHIQDMKEEVEESNIVSLNYIRDILFKKEISISLLRRLFFIFIPLYFITFGMSYNVFAVIIFLITIMIAIDCVITMVYKILNFDSFRSNEAGREIRLSLLKKNNFEETKDSLEYKPHPIMKFFISCQRYITIPLALSIILTLFVFSHIMKKKGVELGLDSSSIILAYFCMITFILVCLFFMSYKSQIIRINKNINSKIFDTYVKSVSANFSTSIIFIIFFYILRLIEAKGGMSSIYYLYITNFFLILFILTTTINIFLLEEIKEILERTKKINISKGEDRYILLNLANFKPKIIYPYLFIIFIVFNSIYSIYQDKNIANQNNIENIKILPNANATDIIQLNLKKEDFENIVVYYDINSISYLIEEYNNSDTYQKKEIVETMETRNSIISIIMLMMSIVMIRRNKKAKKEIEDRIKKYFKEMENSIKK